ncbi:nitroreductase [Halobacteroides halobius DSM 5150]|uniref:Nitroreductase n=1 Tax=Halobacteroides halobius (strain ATCC 35273 / DSM 5150 / MD-1) TaxID=748449 RepID=L0K8A9_HALHC|nr:nitroreductase family protein [Halobacteroides halobius]AGB40338.1 nitroreductase [Halobacteroides halobius DSM 5150]
MSIIFDRRSIRSYTSEPVSEEEIKYLLQAGMAAPSAMNQQPWEFVVIDDREVLDQIPEFHDYAQMVKEAPVVIAVCGNQEDLKFDDPEAAKNYMLQDCSAATQNILLAAEEQGLGSVWLGVYPRKKRRKDVKKLLNLPDKVVPISLVVIGHTNEEKEVNDRYLEEKVHRNQF